MLNRLVRALENFLPHGGFAQVTAQLGKTMVEPRRKPAENPLATPGKNTAETPLNHRENSASAGRVGGRIDLVPRPPRATMNT